MTGFNPQRDELLEQSCLSYQAQFALPAAVRGALAEFSRRLRQTVVSGLWVAPAESLHVTCYSLVSPRDLSFDKDRYWRSMRSQAEEAVRRIQLEVPAFQLRFRTIRVTERAIVVLADDQPSVARARRVFSRLVLPPGAKQSLVYDTIHVTLCRYADPNGIRRDLPETVAPLRLELRADIDTLTLVRETVYPSLHRQTLISASLARIGPAG
ncbi:2'-5' RNA ligase family protein [Bradyrhizobium sp.]|uniref:2'-5' RNA ligase family protein n=1 Tax=Bradyrhizobium sp. TaxID=376 RepID=UPI001EBFF68B|nr:2'-5' RNA ligase family protein [Bradyrhizobium sp.]MBV9978865.1 2'-5' RNA ligase family protein [Bradyrhizobium sp.]